MSLRTAVGVLVNSKLQTPTSENPSARRDDRDRAGEGQGWGSPMNSPIPKSNLLPLLDVCANRGEEL